MEGATLHGGENRVRLPVSCRLGTNKLVCDACSACTPSSGTRAEDTCLGTGASLRSQSWAAPLGGMSWCPCGGGSSAKRGAFSSLPCKGAGKGSRARRTATTSPRHSLPWLVCPDFSGVSLGRGSHCSKVLSDYNFPTLGAFFPISM